MYWGCKFKWLGQRGPIPGLPEPFHLRCSKENKVLLILDNHEAHISLAAIDLAKENGVVLLTMPPHTSHRLQPLDVCCFKPFKTAYAQAMENWMRSNPGKTITIYEIPEFVAHAQLHGLTAKNILSAFQSTGIFPYNRDLFDETDFSPATVTDRDLPEELERNDPIPAEQLLFSIHSLFLLSSVFLIPLHTACRQLLQSAVADSQDSMLI